MDTCFCEAGHSMSWCYLKDIPACLSMYVASVQVLTEPVFPSSTLSGIDSIDQVLNVLLTTAMFVGGCVAFILDNTIPGESSSLLSSFCPASPSS